MGTAVLTVLLLLTLFLTGTRAPEPVVKTHTKPQAEFYKKVAVMPFENLTKNHFAHEIIRSMLINELFGTGFLEVCDPAQVDSILAEINKAREAKIDFSTAQQVAQNLGAGAIILGSVGEYQMARREREIVPEVEVSARMLNTNTGEIIWTGSLVYQGKSRLLGTTLAPSLTQAAQKVISRMVEPLEKELKVAASEGRIKATAPSVKKLPPKREEIIPKREVVAVKEKEKLPIPRPTSEGPPYIGIEECRSCHSNEYEKWKDTRHSRAFQALLKTGQETNPDCLPCHTTGYSRGGGFMNLESTPQMKDVQCESCHGPGSEYTGDNMPKMFTLPAPAEKVCTGCHTQEWSPGFNFQEMREKIKH